MGASPGTWFRAGGTGAEPSGRAGAAAVQAPEALADLPQYPFDRVLRPADLLADLRHRAAQQAQLEDGALARLQLALELLDGFGQHRRLVRRRLAGQGVPAGGFARRRLAADVVVW